METNVSKKKLCNVIRHIINLTYEQKQPALIGSVISLLLFIYINKKHFLFSLKSMIFTKTL